MNISKWALNRGVLINAFVAVLIIGGLWAFTQMPKLEDPAVRVKQALVMSSSVGPRPPVTMTISLSFNSFSNDVRICSRSSAIDIIRLTLTPISLRAVAMADEFVSTICPIRISSPIVHTDAVI